MRLIDFSTRLERGLLQRLKEYCRKTGRSIMWTVNSAITKFLDSEENKI